MTLPSQSETTSTDPVWPPTPNSPDITPATNRPIFRPQLGKQRWIVILASLYGVLELIQAATDFNRTNGIFALTEFSVNIAQIVVNINLIVVFLIWAYNVYRNLASFKTAQLSVTPAWAAAYYFIPILSLYRPYKIMQEVWKASNPEFDSSNTGWKKTSGSATIAWWWAFYLAYAIFSGIASYVLRTGATDVLDIFVVQAAHLVTVIALLLMCRVVGMTNERQNRKEKVMREAEQPVEVLLPKASAG